MSSIIKPRRGTSAPTIGIVENELVVDTTNKRIYIGTAGGSGNLIGSAPGGSDTHIQFNDGGNYGGDSALVYNKTTDTLSLSGTTNSLDVLASTDGIGLRIAQASAGASSAIGAFRLGRHSTASNNTYIENNSGVLTIYNGNDNAGTALLSCDPLNDSATYALSILTINGAAQGEMRLYEANANGSNYTAIKAPSAVTSNVTWTLPSADGTSGQVLSTDGSGTLSWASTGGGGGTKTYAVFTPLNNNPPSTNYATVDTRNSIMVLDFDPTTDESSVFVCVMPEAASLGSGLKVRLHWMATSATSGTCRWGVQLERMNTDQDVDSFDTAATAGSATSGTSGIITTTEITITTIDSIAAGEVFRLKVYRDADGTSGTDDMTGDAELVAVEIRSAA